MAKYTTTQWIALVIFVVMLCSMPVLAAVKSAGGSRSTSAVDAKGDGAVDPTRNVLDLVEKETKRQDDLRQANEKYIDAELRHLREQADLRAGYDKLLREIDTVRQEKVREVDMLGGRTENERSQLAIENTRKLVDSTAAAVASQLDSKFAESNKRLGALELAMGEGRGKQTLSDPQTAQMVEELKNLRTDMTNSTGKGEGMDKLFQYAMTIIGALGGAGIGIYIGRKKTSKEAEA